MNNKTLISGVLLSIGVLNTSGAQAYTNTSPITVVNRWVSEHQSLSILDESKGNLIGGGRALTMGYSMTLGYTDNVDKVVIGEESASYLRFAPVLGYSKSVRDHRYWLNAKGAVGVYDTGSNDGFADFSTQAAAQFNTQGRHRFQVDGRFDGGHRIFNYERSGSANSTTENLDRFHRPSLSARYTLGRQAARVQLGLWGELQQLSYQNNRYATQFYDYDAQAVGFLGAYRATAKTTFLSGLSLSETDYKRVETGFSSRDKQTLKAYLGVRWRSTAKTAGEARLGVRDTDYDSTSFSDPRRLFWRLSVDWRPRVFDVVKIYTSRSDEVARSSEFGDLEKTQYGVRWEHEWNKNIKTRIGVDAVDYRFTTASGVRDDDLLRYVVGVVGPIGRKSSLGLGYVLVERDSSSTIYDYEAEGIELTLQSYF